MLTILTVYLIAQLENGFHGYNGLSVIMATLTTFGTIAVVIQDFYIIKKLINK